MPIFDHFGIIAPFYDRVLKSKNLERLIDLLGLPVSGMILDAGGGTGRISQTIREFSSKVIVADISLGMLYRAASKDGLECICSYTEALPFSDASFDRIIMVDALHHVLNQEKSLQELLRVLIIGGRIVIEEPDIRTTLVKAIAFAEKLALMRSHFLSPQEIIKSYTRPNAKVRLETEKYIAWVIVDKIC